MQINNHFTPTNLGHGSRPDRAANAHGRAPQFQPATADAEPAATTDTTTSVAPTEGPGTSGHSVAHRARHALQINNHFTPTNLGHGSRPGHAANAPTEGPGTSGHSVGHDVHMALFAELGGHNFGWLVSQIASGLDIATETPDGEGEGTDGVVVGTDEVGGDEVATAPDGADATGEESPPAEETVDEAADAGTTPEVVVEDTAASLLDTLTEESEDSTT
ncbi:MAG: hypothetical protein O7F69_02715 [Alphaproteobacteria bacterium]|nr:hypothetical protein [Alphaproteobacteria bacterium]